MQPGYSDDEQLVGALAARDPQAADQLFSRYRNQIYAYCSCVCVNPDLAEEAARSTLLLAVARAAQLKNSAQLTAWIDAIARSECQRIYKTQRKKIPTPALDTSDLPQGDLGPHSVELTDNAAAALKTSQREILDLALRQQLPIADIALVLRTTTPKAQAHLDQAKLQLHKTRDALLLFKTRKSLNCQGLSTAIGRDDAFNPLTKGRIERHAKTCRQCQSAAKTANLDPITTLSPIPMAPSPAPPMVSGPPAGSEAQVETEPDATSEYKDHGPEYQNHNPEHKAQMASRPEQASRYLSIPATPRDPLPIPDQAAQLNKKRRPFDSHGWPRRPSKIPFLQ